MALWRQFFTQTKREGTTLDKLDVIFQLQQSLDDDIVARRNLNYSREEWMQKEVLAMISELSEVLDEVNFKWWKNPKPVDDAALKGEIVDILHFFVSMCLKSGMTAEELFTLYKAKNQENFDRQYGRSQKQGYEIGGDVNG
jgi:dimeric dUTPase (all-alpha-NTP-PPase superfamily)